MKSRNIWNEIIQAYQSNDEKTIIRLIQDKKNNFSSYETISTLLLTAITYRRITIYFAIKKLNEFELNEEIQAVIIFSAQKIDDLRFYITDIQLNANARKDGENFLEHLVSNQSDQHERHFFLLAAKLLLQAKSSLDKKYHHLFLRKLVSLHAADTIKIFFSNIQDFQPEHCDFASLFVGSPEEQEDSALAVSHLLIQKDILVPNEWKKKLLKLALLHNESIIINALYSKNLVLAPETNASSLYSDLADMDSQQQVVLATGLLEYPIPFNGMEDLTYLIRLAINTHSETLIELINKHFKALNEDKVKQFITSSAYHQLILDYSKTAYCLVPIKLTGHIPHNLEYQNLEKIFIHSIESTQQGISLLILNQYLMHFATLRSAAFKKVKLKPNLQEEVDTLFENFSKKSTHEDVKHHRSFKRRYYAACASDENQAQPSAFPASIFTKNKKKCAQPLEEVKHTNKLSS